MANLSELTLMLWNATSLNGKDEEFTYFINNNNVDVALVTETWLNSQTNLKIVNYEIIRSDSPRIIAGGVAIIIKKQLKFYTLPQIKIAGCDIVLIKIQSNLNMTVGVIYVPPKIQFSFDSIASTLNKYSPIILGGDYNARHTTWNNFSNNTRGVQLYKFVNNNDISLIHSNTYTFKVPRKNASNIDIFITKDIPYNYSCYTINDLSSNHLPVFLKFENVNIAKKNITLDKTDWSEFFNRTDKWRIVYELQNQDSIDDSIEKLQKYILKAFKQSSTYHQNNKRAQMGEKDLAAINNLIRLRNYFRRKYQRTGTNRFRLFRNILNSQIKVFLTEKRNEYWSKKLKTLNVKDKSLWKTLKSISRKNITPPPLILANHEIIYDPQQKAEEIAKNFHSVYSTAASLTSPLNPVVNDYMNSLDRLDDMTPPINLNFLTSYTILNIIKKLSNKAPGQDKITANMLKNSSFKITLQIYYIIKKSMQLGYFPKIWKTALVLAFPKPGKAQTSPTSYRPISLLSVISKIYEKIIHTQIMKHLETYKIIINEQFGFRSRHSTVAQLLRITEYFALEMNKKRYSAMLLLDLQKTFDSVWHQGLLYKLHVMEVPDSIIKILRSYLTNRNFIVNFCGQRSSAYDVGAGVPQGSVLGPVLFNIFINDIPKSRNSGLAVYADDTAVFASSWSTTLLTRGLQMYVDDILQYFTDWRMSINPDKSEAIIFTRRRYASPPPIRVLNHKVPWSGKVKYLGVVLDSGLRWGPAVNDRINKTNATFKTLYPLINRKSTLSVKFKLLLYKMCARPALLYAAPVWAAAPRTYLDKLQIVQNKFLCIALNVPYGTRIIDLHTKAEIESIDDIIARMLSGTYNHEHDNPLIRETGNYKICELPFKIRCRLPKHFLPINTYS